MYGWMSGWMDGWIDILDFVEHEAIKTLNNIANITWLKLAFIKFHVNSVAKDSKKLF